MKLIYIAGPFRAKNDWDRENNIRRAETLALEVWRAGFAALCPHCNTRFFDGAAPDEIWLKGDLEMLDRCDALLATPDFERSTGAKAEIAFAQERGIPVFLTLQRLKDAYCECCGVDKLTETHAIGCLVYSERLKDNDE